MTNKLNIEKAIYLYREMIKQPFDVKEALFNALKRDLDEESRGD